VTGFGSAPATPWPRNTNRFLRVPQVTVTGHLRSGGAAAEGAAPGAVAAGAGATAGAGAVGVTGAGAADTCGVGEGGIRTDDGGWNRSYHHGVNLSLFLPREEIASPKQSRLVVAPVHSKHVCVKHTKEIDNIREC